MRQLLLILLTVSLAGADEPQKPKTLAELNGLAKTLCGGEVVAAEEVERLFEQGEVIALRDATRGTTPQAITYACSLDKAMDTYALKGAGPARVLAELSLTLAGLAGPHQPQQADRFRAILMGSLGIKPSEARPMPELPSELAEIGQWAARTVEKLAARLPAEDAALDRLRLRVIRGEYAEAAQLAKQHPELGARGQAWLAAAAILRGESPKSVPTDGEPALIVRGARIRHARWQAADKVGDNAMARCQQLLAHPAGTNASELALPCSTLLWDDPDRAWLARAAQLVPSGNAGAPVRAADDLRVLFGPHRGGPTDRAELVSKYRHELDQMGISADEKRALWLLGNVAAADQPTLWVPSTQEEQDQMLALDHGSPCDAATFALRSLAVRGNPKALGAFAAGVVQRCVSAPGGVPVAADAIGMLLTLAHDTEAPVPAEVAEKLAQALAEAHPTDPLAIGAHADSVAAHALSHGAEKAPLFALEAALARYEEAIQRSSPASGAAARARLENNAAFLSVAILARLEPKKRPPFFLRAQRHLRFALALDEHPASLATRARFDKLTNMRMGTPPSLDRVPPSLARARAACLLASEASAAGQNVEARHYLSIAKSGEKSTLDAPELLIAPQAAFNVTLDERGLHPAAEMHAPLWLAPACDPEAGHDAKSEK